MAENEYTLYTNISTTLYTDPEQRLAAESQLWQAAKKKPGHFPAWQALIQFLEKNYPTTPEKVREGYHSVLVEYPLIYPYWCKLALLEATVSSSDGDSRAKSVFEQALLFLPYSVDLWTKYCSFVASRANRAQHEEVRRLFDRGVQIVGRDASCAYKLWNKYIAFEISNGYFIQATSLLIRILAVPIKSNSSNWDKFQDHVRARALGEILTAKQIHRIELDIDAANARREEEKRQKEARKAMTSIFSQPPPPPPGKKKRKGAVTEEEDEDRERSPPPDDLNMDFLNPPEDGDDMTPTRRYAESVIKTVLLKKVEAVFRRSQREYDRIKSFEAGINLTWYTPEPPEVGQLSNWRQYLLTEEALDQGANLILLYERCLMPCGAHLEFWLRYLHYLESRRLVQEGRQALRRMCLGALRRSPQAWLICSRLEEALRSDPVAVINEAIDRFPLSSVLQLGLAGIYRRNGDLTKCESIYTETIKRLQPSTLNTQPDLSPEDIAGSRSEWMKAVLSYAIFLERVREDRSKCNALFSSTFNELKQLPSAGDGVDNLDDEDVPPRCQFLLAYLLFEIREQRRKSNIERLSELFEECLKQPMPDAFRWYINSLRLQHLSKHSNPTQIRAAYLAHKQLEMSLVPEGTPLTEWGPRSNFPSSPTTEQPPPPPEPASTMFSSLSYSMSAALSGWGCPTDSTVVAASAAIVDPSAQYYRQWQELQYAQYAGAQQYSGYVLQ